MREEASMTDVEDMLERQYSGRSPDVAVVNFVLHKDALAILGRYCKPGRKCMGQFMSRLLFEHDARMEERRRLREAVGITLGDGNSLVR
jgi:hypothetical protein